MNKNNLCKITLVLSALTIAACSDTAGLQSNKADAPSTASLSPTGMPTGGGSDPTYTGDAEPQISIQNYEQLYVTMLKLTGQPLVTTSNANNETNNTPARAIATEYISRTTSFSNSSSASNINAPLILGATSLASAVCNGLVEKERVLTDMNARVFYKNVNFNQAVSSIPAATYDSVVQSFAFEFWGRSLDAEELKAFQDARVEFTTNITAGQQNNTAQTRGLAVMICTAALSSFESISI